MKLFFGKFARKLLSSKYLLFMYSILRNYLLQNANDYLHFISFHLQFS